MDLIPKDNPRKSEEVQPPAGILSKMLDKPLIKKEK
jgi:hypothetical protein